ncbi:phosphoenolpyruvate hydrolase family protein [Rhizobium calliandrae]|uniref:Phosphoenolpyruvate hydrolase family protein n=1 Tax=Rhizobium calliandrae TaxID=1312182 RepID=A0ABT7KPF4_9HYPH|nr:phosphoenolpyruvate hydrolase family protein [Rhizobium calliandrae]MDL2409144.1 phosphoenolpyruvate hydrolase family protein [Rhizobium calliandrae]
MSGIRQFLSNSRSFMLGAAIGSGMTARAAERAGADFVLALNAGRFRAMGGSSPASVLPIRDSNAFVASFGRSEILRSTRLPVFFGACTFDPRLDLDDFLDKLKRWGFAGVTNFPSVIHLDEHRRSVLESCGLGYAREVELLVKAARRGLMTIAYTRTQAEARRMVEAGVEAISMNFNLNPAETGLSSSSIGLAELAARTRDIARTVHAVDRNVVCLLGGGPITKPEELMDVCRETGTQGFIGGSSLDRVPLETSVLEMTSGFKTINVLREKVDLLERQLQLNGYQHGIVARSASMNNALDAAKRLASGTNPVLIVGEPGTGKRRVASLVHSLGAHKHRKPVIFPCRPSPRNQNTVALFGLEADRDTRRRISVLETAAGTSLILLHVNDLSVESQEQLADFLETGTFTAFNGMVSTHSDAKIIASCTVLPGGEDGSLPLTARLRSVFAGLEISLPPLRDRLEDLPALVHHFTVEAKGDAGTVPLAIGNSAFLALASHHWPGNVRELRQVVEQLATLPPNLQITADRLEPIIGIKAVPKETVRLSEREWIVEALRRNKLHRGKTAQALGLSRKTLYNKIRKLKILN